MLLSAAQRIIEGLPLLLKLVPALGQTVPGRRVATENQVARRALKSALQQKEAQQAAEEAIAIASQASVPVAMSKSEVRSSFAESAATML